MFGGLGGALPIGYDSALGGVVDAAGPVGGELVCGGRATEDVAEDADVEFAHDTDVIGDEVGVEERVEVGHGDGGDVAVLEPDAGVHDLVAGGGGVGEDVGEGALLAAAMEDGLLEGEAVAVGKEEGLLEEVGGAGHDGGAFSVGVAVGVDEGLAVW